MALETNGKEKETNKLTSNHQNRKDGNKLINDNRHITCKALKYSELNCDTTHKNHKQILNNSLYDDYNSTKFMLLH
jgi:hypothetical protein